MPSDRGGNAVRTPRARCDDTPVALGCGSKVPKGFAVLSPEQREAARLKSLETRRKNAADKKRT